MKKIIFSIVIFLFFISINVNATELKITKDSNNQINFGDNLTVKIEIENLENSKINLNVKEFIENADPIDPESLITQEESNELNFTYGPSYYSWNISVDGLSIYTIIYVIKPLIFGDFILSPTQVETSSGEIFYSNSLIVKVIPEKNGICEPEKGENYINNPDDCPSGSADGYCDLIQDGICDPDCEKNADPDCITTTTLSTTTTTIPGEKPSKIIWYIIVGIIIAILVFFFIYQMRNQSQQSQQISY
ncbi:MAG: hypothetical protein J7J93_02485 [Candidatus Aenigmarchaeota archaeon]|nr:hypothetical protein [Candidatus Aenigmarchaeota archaeon]